MNNWPVFEKEVFHRNADVYKVMSNHIRLEILNRLRGKEHTVDELTSLLNLRKANTSQHLSILRHYKLVKARRDGKNIHYTITDPKIVAACKILNEVWKNQQQSEKEVII